MNRQQRRASLKHDPKLVVKKVTLTFVDDTTVDLDTNKIDIIDRHTGANLFKTATIQVKE